MYCCIWVLIFSQLSQFENRRTIIKLNVGHFEIWWWPNGFWEFIFDQKLLHNRNKLLHIVKTIFIKQKLKLKKKNNCTFEYSNKFCGKHFHRLENFPQSRDLTQFSEFYLFFFSGKNVNDKLCLWYKICIMWNKDCLDKR